MAGMSLSTFGTMNSSRSSGASHCVEPAKQCTAWLYAGTWAPPIGKSIRVTKPWAMYRASTLRMSSSLRFS